MLFMCIPMLLRRRRGQTDGDGTSPEEVMELRRENARLKQGAPSGDAKTHRG